MNILIPIILGSEVRQFVWSGVVSSLIDQGNNIFLSIRKIDPSLEREIINFESRLHVCEFFKVSINNCTLSYLTFILDYHYDKSNNRWTYKQINKIEWYKMIFLDFIHLIISKSRFIKRTLNNLEQRLLRSYKTTKWDHMLEDYKIDKVVLNVPRLAPLLYLSAYRHKIPVLILFHTNKDIAAMLRQNFNYNAYGVWNQQMKNGLLDKLTNSNPDKVQIIGNSHYCYLIKKLPYAKREEFKNKYSINEGTFCILYTAAAPFVIKNEGVYINDIVEQLAMIGLGNYTIILRKNPMDESDLFERTFSKNKKIIVQTPRWYWNLKSNFNYTHNEDLEEFLFLLESANVCINIPSSVTVEASIKHLPVINLCYFSEGVELLNTANIVDFWEAPFYRIYHKYNFVFPAYHKKDIGIFLEKILHQQNDPKEFENCVKETLAFKIDYINAETVQFICSSK